MSRLKGSRWAALLIGAMTSASVWGQTQVLVGRTAGAGDVSATGAGRYVIPLELPAGTNGLAPSLAVAYDSHGGNGLLGVGFHLRGLSAITRCASTLAQDGSAGPVTLTAADRLCLDGQRLRLTSGTYGASGSKYQTEVEQFARITAFGTAGTGPAWFQVERRDGLVAEYGNTADSRVEGSGSSTPRGWAINRLRDRNGNYVEFVYAEDAQFGSHRPVRINYTGNVDGTAPSYSVRLVYEARSAGDLLTGYFAGGIVREPNRLARIEVTHSFSTMQLRRYEFAYATDASSPTARSRLASIGECVGTACLQATNFDWTVAPAGWSHEVITGLQSSYSHLAIPGDVNGDGFDDLAYYDTQLSRWVVATGSAAGISSAVLNTGFGTGGNPGYALGIDLDANGKRDLLVAESGAWHWLRHRGGTTFAYTSTGVGTPVAGGMTTVADIDGDGREDLVQVNASGTGLVWLRNLTTTGASSFGSEVPLWSVPSGQQLTSQPFGSVHDRHRSALRRSDFNGDGRGDLIVGISQGGANAWVALVSSGTGLVQAGVFDAQEQPLPADFNADGLTDLAVPSRSTGRWQLVFGAGARGSQLATFAAVDAGAPHFGAGAIVDWDGDGRTDLLTASGSAWNVCRSLGDSLAACQPAGLDLMGSARPRVFDANGDGLTDLAMLDGGIRYRLHASGVVDRVARVTDGAGHWNSFTYLPLTNPQVHTPGTGAAYPTADVVAPLYVVRTISTADGSGGSFDRTLAYQGARIHLQGRGFLGFAKRSITDGRDGQVVTQEYLQDPGDFELVGRLRSARRQLPGGGLIESATYTWSRLSAGAGWNLRRFAYLASSVLDEYEVSGAYAGTQFRSTTTRNRVDSYGSLTEQTVTTTVVPMGTTAFSQHVVKLQLSGIVNDATQWCLGRPATSQLTASHTLGSGTMLARTSGFSWDYTRCRLTQTVDEPSDTAQRVATDYEYDGYGNLRATTVSSAGQSPRVTTYAWDGTGRFVQSITDAESQVVEFGWDTVTGSLKSRTDVNGLLTTWEYDPLGRPVRERRPDGTSRTQTIRLCTSDCPWSTARYVVGSVERDVFDQPLRSDEIGLDPLGREIFRKTEMPGGSFSLAVQRYDAFGRRQQSSIPQACCASPSRWMSYAYDARSRLVSVERPLSAEIPTPIRWRWIHEGLAVTKVAPSGSSEVRRGNAAGEIVQLVDANGANTSFEYDAFGSLTKVRDHYGAETTYAYNARGFMVRSNDVDAGNRSFEYLPTGELLQQTDAKGQVTRYTYDRLSRPIYRQEPEGSTLWTWGRSRAARNVGALVNVSASGFQEAYAYDSLGRLSDVTTNVVGSNFRTGLTYDARTGLLETLSYPQSTGSTPFKVRYGYDRGAVVQVSGEADPSVTLWRASAFDALGLATEELLGNGVKVASRFDAVTGRLTGRTSGLSGSAALQDMAYRWGVDDNLVERADLGRGLVERFTYDNRSRLDSVELNGSLLLDLAYDEVGNIVYKSDIGSYSYDAARRHAVVAAGSNRYAYDANGNVASANGSTVSWYSYDLPNTITHPGGNYSAFYYRPDRERYRHVAREGSTLTETIYAAGGLFERVTQGSSIEYRHYVLVDGRRVAVHERKSSGETSTSYLLADHLGSTEAITSASGQLLARLSYQAFGQRRASDWQATAPTNSELSQVRTTTSRGFTGHEHLDNLGLIHMNGRAYDAVLGRFLSPDPVTPDLYNPQALNRYSYVYNNPLTLTDPTGFSPADDYMRFRKLTDGGGQERSVIEALQSHPAITISFTRSRPIGSCAGRFNCGGTVRAPQGIPQPSKRELRSTGQVDGASSTTSAAATVAQTVLNAAVPGLAASGNAAVAIQNGDYAGAAQWYAATVGEVALAVITFGQGGPLQAGVGAVSGAIRAADEIAAAVGDTAGTAGVVLRRNPVTPGPLPDEIAATFRGGSYTETTLDEAVILYRTYGGRASEIGRFWSRTPPSGPLQSTIDLALDPQWGNTARHVSQVEVPAGTTIFEGMAAAQRGLVGGGSQVYIPKIDSAWKMRKVQ